MADTLEQNLPSIARWARTAGFMYLATIASYFAGTWIAGATHTGRADLLLQFATSWATVLLAGCLYAVLRIVNPILALVALGWRLGEAVLGALVVVLRFAMLAPGLGSAETAAIKSITSPMLSATTLFFTAGSTIFFGLFLKSRLIPRSLAAFGLIASVLFGTLACANLLGIGLPRMLAYAWAPMLPAELVTGAWLLIFAVDVSRLASSSYER